MRRYETIFIIHPTANEDEITRVIDSTTGVIEEHGGTILNLDRWGLKKLAYLIRKQNQGYYVYCEYAGVPAAVDEIERRFRIDETVLKYLTVKTQEVYVPDPPKAEESGDEAENEEAVPAAETAGNAAETATTDEAAA